MNEFLDKRNVEDIYELTKIQEGILYYYLLDKKSDQYFNQLHVTLTGSIDMNLLKAAWQLVVDNNEMLRSVFRWEGMEKNVQIILKKSDVDLQVKDFSQLDETLQFTKIKEVLREDRSSGFNLNEVSFRIIVCKRSPVKYDIIISNHHILYDGVSNMIILNDFINSYDYLTNKSINKPLQKNKFKDYIKYINSENKIENIACWQKYLEGIDEKGGSLLKYFSDKTCERSKGYKSYQLKIDENISKAIKDFATQQNMTSASIFYCAWGLLLQKYVNSDDVVFGVTLSNRDIGVNSLDNVVGLFINTLPMRLNGTVKNKIDELLGQVNEFLMQREIFSKASLTEIKDSCKLQDINSLFNTLVVIENYTNNTHLKNSDGSININFEDIYEVANYDITVRISSLDTLVVDFIYNESYFKDSFIEKISEHYKSILEVIINNNGENYKNIDITLPHEKDQLLNRFNDTLYDFSLKPLHRLFEDVVKKYGDRPMLQYKSRDTNIIQTMSYKTLNEKSNQLARKLVKNGVKENDIIAIMTTPSFEMFIGIFAILKSGGAYLAINTDDSADRIEYILNDSKCKAMLTNTSLNEEIAKDCVKVNLNNQTLYTGDVSNLKDNEKINQLAYVLYTSGSTGMPKGVMIEHGSAANFLMSMAKNYDFNEENIFLLKTSYIFDISVSEIFAPIINGGSVVILDQIQRKDVFHIIEAIADFKVNYANFTSSLFNVFIDTLTKENINQLGSLKRIFLGGEKVLPEHINKFNSLNTGILLENVYGPTEATVYATRYSISNNKIYENVPIGVPLENTNIFILDKDNHLCPIGVFGELCIGGIGVAKGYLGKKELTQKQFILNPYEASQVIYKTGDLARWVTDGNIEYLHRIDHQVKLRGYRIELEEIENQILRYREIKEVAVVMQKGADNMPYLVAFFIAKQTISVDDLKLFLQQYLSEYMVPSYMVQLESMPHTTSGKIDKKGLERIDAIGQLNVELDYKKPSAETEIKLVSIWEQVLKQPCDQISVDSNFFQMGGDSLKVMQLISKILREFKVKLNIIDIFKNGSIEKLAEVIDSHKIKDELRLISKEITALPKKEYYDVSHAQKRMWILDHIEENIAAYNIHAAFDIKGVLDLQILHKAFTRLIERHESLRTVFVVIDGELKQKILEPNDIEFNIERIQLSSTTSKAEIENIIENQSYEKFDIENAPLFKLAFLQVDESANILVITIHHLICDEWSLGILIKELSLIYDAYNQNIEVTFKSLPIQYKDFASWQNKNLVDGTFKKEREYWVSHLENNLSKLQLPIDYTKSNSSSYFAKLEHIVISETLNKKIDNICKKYDVTLFIFLMSIIDTLFYKYTNQENITICIPISERGDERLEEQIGLYINTLPINVIVNEKLKYGELLLKVKQVVLRAYEHCNYPFDCIVEDLTKSKNKENVPLFNVMLVLNDSEAVPKSINVGDALLQIREKNHTASSFDLVFYVHKKSNELQISLEYNEGLFVESRMKLLLTHLVEMIKSVVDQDTVYIKDISYMSEVEEKRILIDYNETQSTYDLCKPIYAYFEDQVSKVPNNIALKYKEKTFTYMELNEKANQLAHYLVTNKKIKQNEYVGILMSRSELMIISILGALKAGACYVPIEVTSPKDMIKYMIKDTEIKHIITDDSISVDDYNIDETSELIQLSSVLEEVNIKDNLCINQIMESPAVVLYTSGSTGYPKGIQLPHRSLSAFIHWCLEEFKSSQYDVTYAITSVGFDLSIYEIFFTLASGKILRVLDDSVELMKYLDQDENILLNTVPSFIEDLLKNHKNIDHINIINMAGEPIPITLKEQLDYKRIEVRNLYGPAEDTVYSSCYKFNDDYKQIIPIGKPILNTKFYIVDQNNKIVPHGVIGEICISGQGLALGYLNLPDITKERFIENPYKDDANKILYKTGDLGRWLLDGNIEFIGRKDNQVKIRGYRIELEEIEKVLLNNNEIQDVAVIVKTGQKNTKYLAAYVVPKKERQQDNYEHNDALLEGKTKQALYDMESSIKKINEFNNNKREYPSHKVFHQLFEEVANKNPNKCAFMYDGNALTYNRANERANQFAHYMMKEVSLKTEDSVAIIMDRTEEFATCILGIWKSGGAYIPIDPKAPVDRVSTIVDDAKPKSVIISAKYLTKDLKDVLIKQTKIVVYDEIRNCLNNEKSENPNVLVKPENLAYIIYTSGSTGKPKGAMVEHRGMLNHLYCKVNDVGITEDSIIAQSASQCFDISVWQFFVAGLVGAQINIYSNEQILNYKEYIRSLAKDNVTILEVVPSYLGFILEEIELVKEPIFVSLKYILVTGEQLNASLVSKWFKYFPHIKMINAYGPTEASDDITHFIMEKAPKGDNIPIGKPVQNTSIYIVDEDMKLCPIGIKGEICVSGIGVGRGYINDEEKTKKVFMIDPFIKDDNVRLYKTGDIGRYLPDGNIEFFGRKDQQIKIRGHRIELGEIENKLNQIEEIKDAVVILREDYKGNKYLCAYVTFVSEQTTEEYINNELKKTLPIYMIPEQYVILVKMPLNSNGKVDRKNLPFVEKEGGQSEFIGNIKEFFKQKLPHYMMPSQFIIVSSLPMNARGKLDRKVLEGINTVGSIVKKSIEVPTNEIQKNIYEIWQQVLERKQIGIRDNFFDLGGNSFLLMKAHSMIEELFKEVNVTDLFTYPTIFDLSNFISNKLNKNNNLAQQLKDSAIYFSKQFFIKDSKYAKLEVQNYRLLIEGNKFEQINKKAAELKVSHKDILLTTFIYFVSYVTKQDKITMPTILKKENCIDTITVSLEGIISLNDLYKQVAQQNSGQTYKVEMLDDLEEYKIENRVLPIFYHKIQYVSKREISNIFKIAMELNESLSQSYELIMKFDSSYFNQSYIDKMVQIYSKILNNI